MNASNSFNENIVGMEKSYNIKIGRDNIRVISIFTGTKTASEVIHDAAVKKILFDCKEA